IGISRSVPDPELLDQHAVAYWALGGSAGRRTVSRQPTAVHDSGSPQGRGPAATGPHGCTLVEISTAHTATLTPLTTDVVRWHAEKVEIDPGVDAIQLELQLRQRLQQLLTSHADPSVQVVLVQLAIGGQGPVLGALQQQGVAQQMTAKLCAEFGQQTPALWTISLDAEPRHDFPPAWYEEETMRGEFLRNVRALESARKRKIDLSTYLERLPADLAAALDIPDAATRAEVLQRAATLGGEMLSGHGT
ncbi:MAG: hypothetical protein GTO03_15250, partial [Planctomycetales bacterium]|nr:hypothetical protein [Planctomycetales bacterium]